MRIGTNQLGLAVRWRYEFVGPGTLLAPLRDAVILDVGGDLCPGVLDQHQDARLGPSTSELVLRYPEFVYGHLMDGWLARRDDGDDLHGRLFSPLIVTHSEPDFDAMVSSWLVRRLVTTGELPPFAEALVKYSSLVDQGKYLVDLKRPATATCALHMAYLAIQNLHQGYGSSQKILLRGFDLLDETFRAIESRGKPLFQLTLNDFQPQATSTEQPPTDTGLWRQLDAFADARALLDSDFAAFAVDDEPGRCERRDLLLPAADGGAPIKVAAFIALQPTNSRLNKYWVRARGYPYFICPYRSPASATAEHEPGVVYPRVILSVDPTWKDAAGRKPTLRGLGLRLEQEEAAKRTANGMSDPRGKPPRYDDGSCDNADPWYDGRGHDYTIVDTPRCGTALSYHEVRQIAVGAFWKVRLTQAEVHVAIPLDDAGEVPRRAEEAGIRARGKAPAVPHGVSRALRCWFEESRIVDLAAMQVTSGPIEAPAGFTSALQSVRWFPTGTAPPVRIATFRADPGATLDDLVAWMNKRQDESRGLLYVVSAIELKAGEANLGDPMVLQARLCRGGGTPAELRRGRRLLLFDGRSIAIQADGKFEAHDEGSCSSEFLFELMVYAAFQSLALQEFTRRVGATTTASGAVVGGSRVRREFLRFQARYVHQEVAFDDEARAVYAGLRSALDLGAQHQKTSDDLDRLGDLEESANERVTNWLIFVVGLSGVAQAIAIDWSTVSRTQLVVLGVSIGMAIVSYAGLEWRRSRRHV